LRIHDNNGSVKYGKSPTRKGLGPGWPIESAESNSVPEAMQPSRLFTADQSEGHGLSSKAVYTDAGDQYENHLGLLALWSLDAVIAASAIGPLSLS
jgi:hypothetical protein